MALKRGNDTTGGICVVVNCDAAVRAMGQYNLLQPERIDWRAVADVDVRESDDNDALWRERAADGKIGDDDVRKPDEDDALWCERVAGGNDDKIWQWCAKMK